MSWPHLWLATPWVMFAWVPMPHMCRRRNLPRAEAEKAYPLTVSTTCKYRALDRADTGAPRKCNMKLESDLDELFEWVQRNLTELQSRSGKGLAGLVYD